VSKANETLARRWLGSKHWGGWRVGMAVPGGLTEDFPHQAIVVFASKSGRCIDIYTETSGGDVQAWELVFPADGWAVPDLDHPGTRAFLLEDVRKAWGRKDIVCGPHHANILMVWKIFGRNLDRGLWGEFQTEAEALIAALEAAPGE